MRIGTITGSLTATAKDAQLVGRKMLIADITDARGEVLEPAVVAVDTCGAGVGDTVLIATGSAARLPSGTAGIPIDAAIIAIVEDINVK